MTPKPTYTFVEIIWLIKEAKDIPDLVMIETQWRSEMFLYSLIDIELMKTAAEFMVKSWAKDDVRQLKNLMDRWRKR